MQKTIFGKTGLLVSRTGFGCIPIQRISFDESTALLRHAYENGVTLFDTANSYTTSEERIGIALSHVRDKIVICTKSSAFPPDKLMANIENSLRMLKTDYIDVFQVHNPPIVPRPGEDGIYECLLLAKEQGKIRHIGISSHSKDRAREAVISGLYDTLQYPLSYLSIKEELDLIDTCREHNVGLLAMKGMCGGLLSNAKAAFAFLRQYENVIPIWGMQKRHELEEFLSYEKDPPVLDSVLQSAITADKEALSGNFCRCCGYCTPCSVGIPIHNAARITLLLGRAVKEHWLSEEWQNNMRLIDKCFNCGHCKHHCPYKLDIPVLLKEQQAKYFEILAAAG
ncbi:MAG: aldo/keto reductase [Treponema sp.]|jgi:aryl-alcohol dehydrogenase-like predicted oxidoreductase|nr:aldo/keto reductase [Treponema sp.]